MQNRKSIPFRQGSVLVPLIVAAALGSRPPTLGFQAVDPRTSADAEKTPRFAEESIGEKSVSRVTTGVLTDLVFVVVGSIFMCIFFKLQSKLKSAKQVNEKVIRSDFKRHSSVPPKGAAALAAPSPALLALTDAFYVQVRQGNLLAASAALKEIEAEGKPTIQEYTAVINMCTKANDAETGHVWLDRAKEIVACRSPVCYNGVINAYVKRGELKNAIALAIEMKACRVPLDTVTYNTLIDGCAKAGDAESAEWWMNTMVNAKVKPSVVTIGSMMLACAREGNGQRAMHWLETADSLGIVVNMICFSAVINAFAKAGDLDTAEHWLSIMRKRDVQPSIHCFTGMLESALKNLDIDRAAEIYKALRASGVEPDAALFNWLVTASARAGDDTRAQAWADEASASGFRLNRTARKFVKFDPPSTPAAKPIDLTPKDHMYEVDDEDMEEMAQDLLGKRFVGTIKNYIHSKFGYIVCEETFAVFKRDIFLSSNDNPQEFGKGQRVSFMLFLDKKRNLPRACQLEVASAKDRPGTQRFGT